MGKKNVEDEEELSTFFFLLKTFAGIFLVIAFIDIIITCILLYNWIQNDTMIITVIAATIYLPIGILILEYVPSKKIDSTKKEKYIRKVYNIDKRVK